LNGLTVSRPSFVAATKLLLMTALLTACESNIGFSYVAELPRQFDTYVVFNASGGDVFFGGCSKNGFRPEDCSAKIFRVKNNRLDLVYAGPGRVESIVESDGVIFATGAIYDSKRDSNDWRLLRSDDGGAHFFEAGTIPQSVTAMLAINAAELWVLGPTRLSVTTDGGASWREIIAPGSRNAVRETLAIFDGKVTLIGYNVYCSSDHGRTWQTIETMGARVTAAFAKDCAGILDGHFVFGKLNGKAISWQSKARVQEGMLPRKLIESRDSIFVKMSAEQDSASGRVRVFVSRDSGETWHRFKAEFVVQYSRLDVSSSGKVSAFDVFHRIVSGTVN
jgi:hypothetical protein